VFFFSYRILDLRRISRGLSCRRRSARWSTLGPASSGSLLLSRRTGGSQAASWRWSRQNAKFPCAGTL